jgi:hypothetical protein
MKENLRRAQKLTGDNLKVVRAGFQLHVGIDTIDNLSLVVYDVGLFLFWV